MQTTTAFDLPGFKVVKTLGVVRGITVRTRALPLSIVGSLRTLFGGRAGIFSRSSSRPRMRVSFLWVKTKGEIRVAWTPCDQKLRCTRIPNSDCSRRSSNLRNPRCSHGISEELRRYPPGWPPEVERWRGGRRSRHRFALENIHTHRSAPTRIPPIRCPIAMRVPNLNSGRSDTERQLESVSRHRPPKVGPICWCQPRSPPPRLAARRRIARSMSSRVARRFGCGSILRKVDTSRVAAASFTDPSASTLNRSRSPTLRCIKSLIALGIVTCPLLEIVDSLMRLT